MRFALAGLAALLLAALAAWWFTRAEPPAPAAADPVAEFLDRHWQRPLPAQGAPPPAFSALEASLDPHACGSCHTQQYADWRQSLHSQTVTAGLLWQLRLMPQAEANRCLDCHAPLAEQKALLAREHGWPGAPAAAPPAYISETLAHDGLSCAGCHVRAHARFGPEPRAQAEGIAIAHDGFTASAAFSDSRFCAACHQFPDDGPRTAGKLREDTWRQWQASRHAEEGRQCQSCHMPDRRHQWRGIHSPEQVRDALDVAMDVKPDGRIEVRLSNVGAGHHLPTYMVPKLYVSLRLVGGRRGEREVFAQHVIGWDVDVSLENERFDTRIAAGETQVFEARLPAQVDQGDALELRVDVAPREHYERTFQSMFAQAELLDAQTLALLRQAHDEAIATRFEALRLRRPLSPAAP